MKTANKNTESWKIDEREEMISIYSGEKITSGPDNSICGIWVNENDKQLRLEAMKDAKLIAAAPEMLDALIHAEVEIETLYERLGYSSSNILKMIKKVIEKAI